MRLAMLIAALLAGSPALAQPVPGLAGSTVGLPANPFASNYPSAPPSRRIEADIANDAAPRRVLRVRRPQEERRLRPPASIPR